MLFRSELGSQAFLRRWYFVLRHGRVGRCQAKNINNMKIASSLKSLKKRDLNSKLVRRRGRVYVINKKNPKDPVSSDINLKTKYETIFLIDDVLNTGKTLTYSLSFLLKFNFKSIKTLVLIDRNHKEFPIKVDYKGISLSTNIDDNIKLVNDKKNLKAVLF